MAAGPQIQQLSLHTISEKMKEDLHDKRELVASRAPYVLELMEEFGLEPAVHVYRTYHMLFDESHFDHFYNQGSHIKNIEKRFSFPIQEYHFIKCDICQNSKSTFRERFKLLENSLDYLVVNIQQARGRYTISYLDLTKLQSEIGDNIAAFQRIALNW